MAYRNSSSRRLRSATSSVGAPYIVSNTAMREQRPWIFFLTAIVPCRLVRQESALSGGW